MKKISVILTTYNVEKYIEKCIDSILNQTYKEFELIIIDDKSTDHTIDIIKDKYPYLRLIENNHIGVAEERNLGIKVSNCDYICFLDSDDYFESTMLEKLYNSILEHDSDLAISSAYKFDDKTGDEVELKYMLNEKVTNKKSFLNINDLSNNLFQLTVANAWAKLFKKKIIIDNNIKFQNLNNSNDVLFVYSYIVQCNNISFVYEPLVHYRFNSESSIQGNKKKHPSDFLKAYRALQEYLIEINKYEIYKQSFIEMIINIMIWNLNTLKNDKEIIKLIKLKYYDFFNIDCLENKNESYNILNRIIGD